MNDDHFLTTEEVLDYLQINLRTAYRLIKAGKLPAIRVGRQWRYRKKDLDAWLTGGVDRAVADGAAHRARVLVVDDDRAVREMIAQALRMADYTADVAADGPSAIEQLQAQSYDLLITDLKMPGMDGLTVIRAARRRSPDMPVVIVTGYSTEASAIEAINLGVSGYLTKPFRLPRILAVAARALGEPLPAAEL
jgi:excisionase family DNA binding protein